MSHKSYIYLTAGSVIIFSIAMLIGPMGLWAPTVQPAELPPYSGILLVEIDDGTGSCFVVAQRDGWWYAITANHVVEDMLTITVDEELYDAEVVRIDPEEDIALIRFKSPETYRVYTFAKTEVEASCTTVGWSRGNRLVFKGFIVALDLDGFIAANGGVVPGCSGGVLLDSSNQVVGITMAVAVYGFNVFDSTSLYIPARYAEAMVVALGE